MKFVMSEDKFGTGLKETAITKVTERKCISLQDRKATIKFQ